MNHILIVDDSPTIRRMVRASLREISDARLIEAGSGLEAIECLALSPATLVILDLNMPDLHGLDVLRFMREHRAYREIPVIILTTRGDDAARAAALEAGATLFLTKPFEPKVLSGAVTALMAATNG
jgi:two-component system chemotaxis response regulator CheY